jgi:hypothetical protein
MRVLLVSNDVHTPKDELCTLGAASVLCIQPNPFGKIIGLKDKEIFDVVFWELRIYVIGPYMVQEVLIGSVEKENINFYSIMTFGEMSLRQRPRSTLIRSYPYCVMPNVYP